jgi:hypothetical protein
MARRLCRVVEVVVALAVVGVSALLGRAHWGIGRERPRLPAAAEVLAAVGRPDGPTRLRWIETASQRGADGRQVVRPVFVLEWPDGRVLLVDTGEAGSTHVLRSRQLEE